MSSTAAAADECAVFAQMLRAFRERATHSRNSLALEVGVDPSYVARIEHGTREPPRQYIIEALANGLRLSAKERHRLLLAAGHAPLGLLQWSDIIYEVCEVLNNTNLSDEERAEFQTIIHLVAAQWHRTARARALALDYNQ